MKRNIAVLVLSVFSGCLFFCSTVFGQYQIIDLGTLGGSYSEAFSINNNGQIVGSAACVNGHVHAVLYDATGHGNNIDLGTVAGTLDSEALHISDSGMIVGYVRNPFEPSIAGVFDASGNGQNHSLGNGMATCVNSSGTITGGDDQGGKVYAPTPVDLGPAYPRAINNSGTAVGVISSGNNLHACIIDITGSGKHTDLDSIPRTAWNSEAFDINSLGKIIGISEVALGTPQATLFDPSGNGNNILLGSIKGGIQSEAIAVNDIGQVVGMATVNLKHYAAIFDITGQGNNYDLNDLIDIDSQRNWFLYQAVDINNDGWIVGNGYFDGEPYKRGFLLVPIPEPCTLALLALGGVALLRKRRVFFP